MQSAQNKTPAPHAIGTRHTATTSHTRMMFLRMSRIRGILPNGCIPVNPFAVIDISALGPIGE
jgi:hypothetical protein